jgi:hypothetical protein
MSIAARSVSNVPANPFQELVQTAEILRGAFINAPEYNFVRKMEEAGGQYLLSRALQHDGLSEPQRNMIQELSGHWRDYLGARVQEASFHRETGAGSATLIRSVRAMQDEILADMKEVVGRLVESVSGNLDCGSELVMPARPSEVVA